jgi:bifunctional non-homologous end joining protein LigD
MTTTIHLPLEPMAPLSDETVPTGHDWGYQLKWDGVRIVASIQSGVVTLYSRQGLIKNDPYPELVQRLRQVKGNLIVDGEAVVFDPDKQRPVFQKVLQRERMVKGSQTALTKYPVTYVLFDLIEWEGRSFLAESYTQRFSKLQALFPDKTSTLFVTDLYTEWQALWQWVVQHEWEGIVSKRMSSPYKPGKQHKDWFKKKIKQTFTVDIVAVTYREGRLASLVMAREGVFFGKISLGLNMTLRQRLDRYAQGQQEEHAAFSPLPAELKGNLLIWLTKPFRASVQGLEVTTAGLLRHPKIIELHLPKGV